MSYTMTPLSFVWILLELAGFVAEKLMKTSRPVNESWLADFTVMNCPAQENSKLTILTPEHLLGTGTYRIWGGIVCLNSWKLSWILGV